MHVACKAEQKQPRSTADLQDTPGVKRQNPVHRSVNILPHLLIRDRLTCVSAVPANGVEARILVAVGLAIIVVV